MKLFGLLVDGSELIAVGPMEEVDTEAGEFFVLTTDSARNVMIHTGSSSLYFIATPVPSVN